MLLSAGYTLSRKSTLEGVYAWQRLTGRPKDLETGIHIGHKALKWLSRTCPWAVQFPIPSGQEVCLYDIQFPYPLILAAYEGDLEMVKIWEHFGLGGVTLKTVLLEERQGNSRPRIQEIQTPHGKGLINAMGLPGKGVGTLIRELNHYIPTPNKPVGLSIGGHTLAEYINVFKQLHHFVSSHPVWRHHPTFFELNISCPNTSDGQNIVKNPTLLTPLLSGIRDICKQSIVSVKLSPDQSNEALDIMASLIKPFGKMALTLGNTQYRTASSLGLPPNALSTQGGGLSGPALFERTVAMTQHLHHHNLPIIATGGVCAATFPLLKSKGATLAGVASAMVSNPYCM